MELRNSHCSTNYTSFYFCSELTSVYIKYFVLSYPIDVDSTISYFNIWVKNLTLKDAISDIVIMMWKRNCQLMINIRDMSLLIPKTGYIYIYIILFDSSHSESFDLIVSNHLLQLQTYLQSVDKACGKDMDTVVRTVLFFLMLSNAFLVASSPTLERSADAENIRAWTCDTCAERVSLPYPGTPVAHFTNMDK